MQVDPIKSTLKAPGIKLLKLECEELLSTFAFKLNLSRYNEDDDNFDDDVFGDFGVGGGGGGGGPRRFLNGDVSETGFSGELVRWCRLPLSTSR